MSLDDVKAINCCLNWRFCCCCHRLYHNSGQVCTEVDSVSDTTMAIFAPGDATMLYCITPQGVKLRSLRALPECDSFCQTVDISLPARKVAGNKVL